MSITFGWAEINELVDKWIKDQRKAGKEVSIEEVIKVLNEIKSHPISLVAHSRKEEAVVKINYIKHILKLLKQEQKYRKEGRPIVWHLKEWAD